jgi:hypothetical protein
MDLDREAAGDRRIEPHLSGVIGIGDHGNVIAMQVQLYAPLCAPPDRRSVTNRNAPEPRLGGSFPGAELNREIDRIVDCRDAARHEKQEGSD